MYLTVLPVALQDVTVNLSRSFLLTMSGISNVSTNKSTMNHLVTLVCDVIQTLDER